MSQKKPLHHFVVVADADPGALHRICGILTTLELIPHSLRLERDHRANGILLEIVMSDADPRRLDLLQRKIGQLVPVVSVSSR